MNQDNDFDEDGNNIVPCPICLNVHCPSKVGGKCPDEDMFAIEAEIRLLLDEYKNTGDNSRIANVLEGVDKITTAQQTAHESDLKSLLNEVESLRNVVNKKGVRVTTDGFVDTVLSLIKNLSNKDVI